MASTSILNYYRLRKEVPGIYVVRLRLELQPSERATVDVGRYRDRGYDCCQYYGGSCGHQPITQQYPKNPLEVESLQVHEYNEIGNFWQNDTITIEVRDTHLEQWGGGPHQTTVITATMEGMEVKDTPCTLHNRTWSPITFTEIIAQYGGEYVPAPPPQQQNAFADLVVSSSEQSPVTPPAPSRDIDLQKLAALIDQYRTQYPHLAQCQIVQLIGWWTDPHGVLNKKALLKSLQKSNIKAQKKAQASPLAVQQAEEIIENGL